MVVASKTAHCSFPPNARGLEASQQSQQSGQIAEHCCLPLSGPGWGTLLAPSSAGCLSSPPAAHPCASAWHARHVGHCLRCDRRLAAGAAGVRAPETRLLPAIPDGSAAPKRAAWGGSDGHSLVHARLYHEDGRPLPPPTDAACPPPPLPPSPRCPSPTMCAASVQSRWWCAVGTAAGELGSRQREHCWSKLWRQQRMAHLVSAVPAHASCLHRIAVPCRLLQVGLPPHAYESADQQAQQLGQQGQPSLPAGGANLPPPPRQAPPPPPPQQQQQSQGQLRPGDRGASPPRSLLQQLQQVQQVQQQEQQQQSQGQLRPGSRGASPPSSLLQQLQQQQQQRLQQSQQAAAASVPAPSVAAGWPQLSIAPLTTTLTPPLPAPRPEPHRLGPLLLPHQQQQLLLHQQQLQQLQLQQLQQQQRLAAGLPPAPAQPGQVQGRQRPHQQQQQQLLPPPTSPDAFQQLLAQMDFGAPAGQGAGAAAGGAAAGGGTSRRGSVAAGSSLAAAVQASIDQPGGSNGEAGGVGAAAAGGKVKQPRRRQSKKRVAEGRPAADEDGMTGKCSLHWLSAASQHTPASGACICIAPLPPPGQTVHAACRCHPARRVCHACR